MTQTLSQPDINLLQQVHDGEMTREEVGPLLEQPAARVYLTALGEMQMAAQIAMEVACDKATFDANAVVSAAQQAASLVDAPLEELAPMLERFHDGEVDAVEGAVILALIEEREELADYIASLDVLTESVRVAENDVAAGVNFDGFFDKVAAQIGLDVAPQQSDYTHDEHRVLVYRYNDGEASSQERDRVESWVAADHNEVVGTLDALAELKFSATTAVEFAQERVDFSHFWGDVQDKLDDATESQGGNVISIGRKRREKESFFQEYRQSIYGAVAATAVVALFLGLFGPQIFGTNERVIERIVIVDSVEYAPGASVMINSPMQPASADSDAIDSEEEPTVIWLLDSGEDSLEEDGEDELNEETEQEGQPI